MEFLDIVDEKDRVIGKASRDEIYNKKYKHRIVHVMIHNERDEIALQLRSNKVSFCPSHWSTAVGGHVQSTESYEQAALREYMEELGINSKLEHLSKDFYQADDSPGKFLGIFTTKYNGEFKINTEVVEKIDFFSLNQIREMIECGEKFHPELLFILKKYYL